MCHKRPYALECAPSQVTPPNPRTTPRPVAGPFAPPHPASRADSHICGADASPERASGRGSLTVHPIHCSPCVSDDALASVAVGDAGELALEGGGSGPAV